MHANPVGHGTGESRQSWLRRALHSFLPSGLHDPIGLARRLTKSGDAAALFALRAAALGPVFLPLDLLLTPFEGRRYRHAAPPRLPIIVVCGCARSGTTIAAQLLQRLPVAYFTNLTSIFPRSPLTAEAAFGRFLPAAKPQLHNFYGRTSGWTGANDALYLWDRWLGSDRARIPETISPAARAAMIAFFGARESQTGRPALVKVNALNASAHLVADALPTARFICIQRSRVALAMSLLKARQEIHGRADIPYGLMPPDARPSGDPVDDVCRQVVFHENLARQQQERLGADRFRIVPLDAIRADPDAFVEQVARDYLGEAAVIPRTGVRLEDRSAANDPRTAALMVRLQETFDRMDRGDS